MSWKKITSANHKAENTGASVTHIFADDHPPTTTLTGRNGEWHDRWYVHDEVDVIAPPNRNTFRMIYLTHRWARALVGESSRWCDDRVETSTPGAAENALDAIFRAYTGMNILTRARVLPTETELGYGTNIHPHKRRVASRRARQQRRRQRRRRQRQGCER